MSTCVRYSPDMASRPVNPDNWTTIRVPIELRTRLTELRAKAKNGETMHSLIALGLDALEKKKGGRRG